MIILLSITVFVKPTRLFPRPLHHQNLACFETGTLGLVAVIGCFGNIILEGAKKM